MRNIMVHNAQYWGELEYTLSKYSNFPTSFGKKTQSPQKIGFFYAMLKYE